MTVGILVCGEPPEALIPQHGTYLEMVQRLLGPGRDTAAFDVTDGVLPTDAATCRA